MKNFFENPTPLTFTINHTPATIRACNEEELLQICGDLKLLDGGVEIAGLYTKYLQGVAIVQLMDRNRLWNQEKVANHFSIGKSLLKQVTSFFTL